MSEPRRPRVCLVVDHPLRDLDGLVLVAAELTARGAEVCLVPMYHKHEVFLLRPDGVLLNYVRFANIDFVRACRRLGITVSVLDSEGGVRQDLGEYAEQLRPYLDDVSGLLVWGRAQARAIEAVAAGRARIHLTGSPRYDFAAQPWRSALGDIAPGYDDVVLVNANFPLADPRFQDSRRESRELVDGMRMDEERVRRITEQVVRARSEVAAAVARLAVELPHTKVVVRPHPFERHDFYRDAFAGLPNADVVQTGSVLHWIAKARVVVHYNCSTAIESFLMEREPVHLAFIDAPLLEQPTSVGVSRRAASFEELLAVCRQAVDGGLPATPAEIAQARERVVREYFLADDGRAHQRVADAILDDIAQEHTGRGRGASLARALRAQRRPQAIGNVLASGIAGAAGLERLRRLAGRPADPAKAVPAEQVRATLRRLAGAAHAFAGMDAAPARVPTGARLASVRVTRRAAA